ncbi:MAG: tRNA-guanine transglycosylase, partial [Desulfobacteraceae bacterium]|nr:tRNA-guanine transglycosylase [Desulfobacteraceae bacterium]
ELDISYLALGSLVPFFNKNHDMGFVGTVIKDARDMCGKNMPIHVYGAGDPVELPFMAALGANVFDSSSYAHYANQGWYMTPFGATRDSGLLASGEFRCSCEYCLKNEKPEMIFEDAVMLACHNLWTIIQTMKKIREALRLDSLDNMIEDILERHMIWFPDSGLSLSWAKLHE